MARKVKSELRVFVKDGRVKKIEKWIFTLKSPRCIYYIERKLKKGVMEYHCKTDSDDLWELSLESTLRCFDGKFTAKIRHAFALKNPTKQSVSEIFNERDEYEVVFNDSFPTTDKFKSRLLELSAKIES